MAVRRTGAMAGGVYLKDTAEEVLGLVVLCGLPVEAFAPWWRAALASRGPTPDALYEDRLVWVGSQEELARLYPRSAASIPYPLAFAVAPLRGVRQRWGTLMLMWPAGRSSWLTLREREHIAFSSQSIAQVLDAANPPPTIPDRPRYVPPLHHPRTTKTHQALAAADLVERLPLGALSLDPEGRITFANTAATDLLGKPVRQLLGTQPWQSLPWLDNVTCMDTYRTAVTSREPAAMTVLSPPDRWLGLRLYPGDSGISVLITPSSTAGRSDRPVGEEPAAVGTPDASRIHLLVYLAAALTDTVSVQDVVNLAADQILPAFGAQGLIMSTTEVGRIRIIGYRGYDPEVIERLDGLPTDADLTPAGHALATGTASFFTDRTELARAYPGTPQTSDKHAWAFLPLITSGRPIGCCLLAYNRPHTFTAAERSVLTPLAGLIAQALDRARLYDAKHNLAHALQQTLLPHTLPTVTGLDVAARYLPASHGMDIGGDFYDLIRLTDTTAAAIIGDVQGHDVTAAALMGQVRTAVHSHATAGAPPDQVLARTDRDLADLDAGRFASCLYAHLDLAHHRVTLTSAGHPPPLLRHPDHRAQAVDIDPGPPLGLGLGTPSYPLTSLPLPPGSLLALYTDGLVEVPGTDITDRFRMPSCGDAGGSWNNPFSHGLRGDGAVWNGLGLHGSSCLATSRL
ncbi:SpoIIE family protein phosphatase [Streptomyces roseifaciens]|uniref:SpoIIE family protein phosphatase n=1 Tax=Streptomyces roseifaciens TaxID=1488406 RepID=UPI000A957739|nr:SpoIIE family protein phosphatase [Streptomyces roseifaciens]